MSYFGYYVRTVRVATRDNPIGAESHRRLGRSRHECHDRPVLEARDAVDVLHVCRRKVRELLKQLLEGRQPGLIQP